MSITIRKQIVAVVVAVFAALPALAQTQHYQNVQRYGEWRYSEREGELYVDDFSGTTRQTDYFSAESRGRVLELRVGCARTTRNGIPGRGGPKGIRLSFSDVTDETPFDSPIVRFIWDEGEVETELFDLDNREDWGFGQPSLRKTDRSVVSKLMRHSNLRLEVQVRRGNSRYVSVRDSISLNGSSRAIGAIPCP